MWILKWKGKTASGVPAGSPTGMSAGMITSISRDYAINRQGIAHYELDRSGTLTAAATR
jgi:hypothetical protein